MANQPPLPIHDMAKRHTGLTEAIASAHTEAAGVCLSRHHQSPTAFDLHRDGDRSTAAVAWSQPSARTVSAWANDTDATEAGACACALAAVELVDGLVAVRRAETKTGADYYIAPRGSAIGDLEDCLRLEVSGVDKGRESIVNKRVGEKLAQAAAGNSNLPAMAGVVGFKAKLIVLADLNAASASE